MNDTSRFLTIVFGAVWVLRCLSWAPGGLFSWPRQVGSVDVPTRQADQLGLKLETENLEQLGFTCFTCFQDPKWLRVQEVFSPTEGLCGWPMLNLVCFDLGLQREHIIDAFENHPALRDASWQLLFHGILIQGVTPNIILEWASKNRYFDLEWFRKQCWLNDVIKLWHWF